MIGTMKMVKRTKPLNYFDGNICLIETFHNLNLMLEFMFFIDFLIDPIFVIEFLIIFGKIILDSKIIYNQKV